MTNYDAAMAIVVVLGMIRGAWRGFRDPPDNNLILIRDFPFWFSEVRQMG